MQPLSRLFLTVLLALGLMPLFAQFKFEPGYIILNSGLRQTCLILNKDWRDNPTKIQWKPSENSPEEEATIDELQGFGIDGFSEYVRATLPIDQTSVELNKLSQQREPEWEIRTVFLKTLIRGTISMYSVRDWDTERYFLQQGKDSIYQLVYKQFEYKHGYLMYNEQYKSQLQALPGASNCFNVFYYEDLPCRQRTLMKHMMKYFDCQGLEPDFVFKKPPVSLNLGVEIGATYTDMTQRNDNQIAAQVEPLLGINAEVVPPFLRDRLTFFLNFTGRIVQNEGMFRLSRVIIYPATVNHRALEAAIGARWYFPIKQNWLYLEVAAVNEAGINSNVAVDYGNTERTFKISPEFSVLGGIGYKTRKWYVNGRFYTPREFLSGFSDANANMTVASLRVGYYLVKTR